MTKMLYEHYPAETLPLAVEIDGLVDGNFTLSDESYTYGATDSAHNVFFGSIEEMEVAVKPFEKLGERERAWREAEMMEKLVEQGFDTFKPVGVYEGVRAAYLVTEFMPDISTMNQIGWEKSADPYIYKSRHLPLLRSFGKFVGTLHSAGLVHADICRAPAE